jgi:hypothetical protein
MRIAWFTPFAADSAVAQHSAAVAAVLGRSCEVEIWTEDPGPLEQTPLGVHRWGGADSLAGIDTFFYNLADAVTLTPPGGPPGIVILHRPLPAAAPPPPPTLGLVTHFASDVAALEHARLEPVVALEPAPVEAYAAALLEFLARAQRTAPALELLDRVGAELGAMRAAPTLGVHDAIASDFGRFLAL